MSQIKIMPQSKIKIKESWQNDSWLEDVKEDTSVKPKAGNYFTSMDELNNALIQSDNAKKHNEQLAHIQAINPDANLDECRIIQLSMKGFTLKEISTLLDWTEVELHNFLNSHKVTKLQVLKNIYQPIETAYKSLNSRLLDPTFKGVDASFSSLVKMIIDRANEKLDTEDSLTIGDKLAEKLKYRGIRE